MARPHTPIAVTRAHVDALRNWTKSAIDTSNATTRGPEAGLARAAMQGRLNLATPSHMPALGQIFVSPQGTVLVERLDLYGDPVGRMFTPPLTQPAPWDVFDAGGRFLGTVKLPVRFTIRTVTDDAVVGVLRDELNVEYVARYRFR